MRSSRSVGFITALLLLIGSGCADAVNQLQPTIVPAPEWTPVGEGTERIALPTLVASSTHIVAYAFLPEMHDFQFAFSTSSHSVVDWQQAFPASIAAVNGAFFHEDLLPSGMLITQGEYVGERAFDTDKSGLLELAPIARIIDGTAQDVAATSTQEAAQSFPILVRNHEAAVQAESGKVARRTFAAVRDDGAIIFGVVADGAVTLYQLAQELARQEVHVQTALNLDGGPSTGMSVQLPSWQETADSMTPVPIAIIITPTKTE